MVCLTPPRPFPSPPPPPQLSLPFLPLGPLSPPLPVLCFQPPRSPSPASVAVPTRPPLPRWRVSLCLTGSRLRRAPPAPHIHTAAARGGREGGADGSQTVDLVSARNSRETLPRRSRPSPTIAPHRRAESPPSHTASFLSRRVGPGYLATSSFPSSGVTQHSVAFQLPLTTSCLLPLQSL